MSITGITELVREATELVKTANKLLPKLVDHVSIMADALFEINVDGLRFSHQPVSRPHSDAEPGVEGQVPGGGEPPPRGPVPQPQPVAGKKP